MLEYLSRTGGHLASNLGVVELTVALHRVLDTKRDRLVFDVGHQSYVHKLLTGRLTDFGAGFRSFGGISGFPKPAESEHDAFISGHASTSVSVALGMARARALTGEGYRVAALIGDGALTGGLAYEGLSDAGLSGEALVVVLNDNGMSITKNVGAVANLLTRLRLKPGYFGAKRAYHKVIGAFPPGRHIDKFLAGIKKRVRDAFVPGTFFEQMGYIYLGPVDGHDIAKLEFLLRQAFSMRRPVLLHAVTKKGKGYSHAENDPGVYHGVGCFEVDTGDIKAATHSFSAVFGEKLLRLAEKDRRICAVTAAMCGGTGLDGFKAAYPERFFDVGIAEGHAVTMASGMAKQGLRPVCAIYSTFLQRAYDNILHDTAIQNLPVVFAVDRAGLVGEDGETHQGIFDTHFLGSVPGITLYAPASYAELERCLEEALACAGPAAIRYPRGGQGAYDGCGISPALLSEGGDATIVTYGIMTNVALAASDYLRRQGVSVSVVKLTRVVPLDTDAVLPLLSEKVFLLEDNIGVLPRAIGGTAINTGCRFIPHGTVEQQLRHCGLDYLSVAKTILSGIEKA
jgi:1-deoxy-D-xylulose-5-phosphate synthase